MLCRRPAAGRRGLLPFSPTERGTGQLDVSVDLVAAPDGSTISIGEPYVVPSTPSVPRHRSHPLAIVAVVGLGLLVLVVVRRRRRA
jgi:MYXO-CTERM domain-containing protein